MSKSGNSSSPSWRDDLHWKAVMLGFTLIVALLPLYWWLSPNPNGHGARDYFFGGMAVVGLLIAVGSVFLGGRRAQLWSLIGLRSRGVQHCGFLHLLRLGLVKNLRLLSAARESKEPSIGSGDATVVSLPRMLQ
ncbi:MAG: hypothetical protein U0904_10145 [Candidatus Nanopelagicales bacterium]|nr:hypothetical protein [Candidatus Nanopelagicales bacterium]